MGNTHQANRQLQHDMVDVVVNMVNRRDDGGDWNVGDVLVVIDEMTLLAVVSASSVWHVVVMVRGKIDSC